MVNAHDPSVDEARYFRVIERKTACLFEAGARMAAAVANCTPEQEEAVAEYALALGNASRSPTTSSITEAMPPTRARISGPTCAKAR